MKRAIAFATVILFSLSTTALAAETIKNWSAPSTWTPPSAQATGRSALVTYPPLPFIPVTPCRVADTRGNGFTGTYGQPFMAGGVPRNFTITGQCGIPAGAQAVSFNFTVTNTAGPGFLKVFPQGDPPPIVSTLNYVASQTIANAAVVPLGSGGLTAIPGVSGFDLLIDVNGYYTTNVGTSTFVITSTGGYGIVGVSSTNVGVWGLGPTHGVFGQDSSGGLGDGVYGLSSAGYGVRGLSSTNNGVWAESTSQDGLFASGGRDGGYLQGGRHGVIGFSTGATGALFGVYGAITSPTAGAAGVFGTNASGAASGTSNLPAGVIGSSKTGIGVEGTSDNAGVRGEIYDGAGVFKALGILGLRSGSTYYGVWSTGDYGGTGAKSFVEPHPTDASRVIRYICLEGPEAGTYFRGTARTVGGQAVIEVPESFRMVSDEEDLTVQLTPVGALTTIAVMSQDLNSIVVRSLRDVSFHYIVHGIRRAFKGFNSIVPGEEFAPWGPKAVMQASLQEEVKRRLVANGTYNADGTVNMATAERMGWAQKWRDDEAKAKAAQAAAATKAKAN